MSSSKWKKKVNKIIAVQSLSPNNNSLQVPSINEPQEEVEPDVNVDVLRRFCFESIEQKQARKNRKQGIHNQLSAVELDINDVTDKDDDDITEQVSTMVAFVLNSVYFKGLIFVVIGINAVHIALQTVESIYIPYSYIFYIIDNLIMGIFICEIILKWYSGFLIFWKDYWNILDFIVILVLHLGPWLAFFSNTRLLRILRVIRAFRSLKTVTSLTGLSLVVETILQSIPDMANIMVLLLIFMVVLSVVGVKLFGKFVPEYFGDPIKCMFSIFVCFTQDGWMQIFRNFERYAEDDKFTYISACFFFILTILMAAFIIANLIVAVVTTNLDKAMKEMKEEQKNNRISLSTENRLVENKEKDKPTDGNAERVTKQDEDMPDIPIVPLEEILETASNINHVPGSGSDKLKQQKPLYKCDLSHITTEKIEDYYLLIVALDENLKEHFKLRGIITSIVKSVKGLNEEDGVDAEAAKLLMQQKKSQSLYEEVSTDQFGNLDDSR